MISCSPTIANATCSAFPVLSIKLRRLLENRSVIGALLIQFLLVGHTVAGESSAKILSIGGVVREATLKGDYLVQTGNPENLRFVTDPESSSKKVLELTLRRGDPEAATSHRTEILGRKDGIGNQLESRWYGFSFFIPADWKPDPSPIVIAQLHGNDFLRLAPPVSLQIQGGRMFLMLQHNVNSATSKTPPVTGNSVRTYPWRGPLILGRWCRLIVRTFWSTTPGIGELEVWLNDDLLVTQRGIPNTYDTSEGIGGRNYAKTGIYAPYGIEASDTVKILTRGIVFGGPDATYEDIVDALGK